MNTDNQKVKGNILKAISGIILILLLFGIGFYFSDSKKKSVVKPSEQFTPTPKAEATGMPQGMVTVSLPVIKLGTSYGIDGVPTPSYPPAVTVTAFQDLVSQLSAYGVGNRVVIGPKDWTGEGLVGADGNVSITLYPKSAPDEGKKITVFIASPGTGSALWGGVGYNSWIRDHWQELWGLEEVPTPPEGIRETEIAPNTFRYSLPDTDAGLAVNGVVFSDAQEHQDDNLWSLLKIEVVLPSGQYLLTEAILDDFIKRQNLLGTSQ
jgi:hypothetical protein